jgi:hypothetical protein
MASLKGAGTEDKKKVAIAAALGVAVLALAIHTIFSGPSATPFQSTAQVQPIAVSSPSTGADENPDERRASTRSEAAIDPHLHPEWMAENENYLYTGNGRNIFSETSGPPPPPVHIESVKGPVRPSMEAAAAARAAAGPPQIDRKFFGYVAPKNGGPRRAFLLAGNNVFVAGVGDVVSHRYRIVQIAPTSIQVEDLPYSDTQTLPLTRN